MGNFFPWPSLVIIRLFVVTFNTRVHFPLFSNVFFLPKFETKRLKKMHCLSTSYILFALTKSYNMKRRHLNLFTAANLPDINCSVGRNGLELVKKTTKMVKQYVVLVTYTPFMYTPRRNKATVTFFLGNQKTYFTRMFASFADKNNEIFKFP